MHIIHLLVRGVLVVVLQEIPITQLEGLEVQLLRVLIQHGVLQDMDVLEVIRFLHQVMVLAVAAVP